MENEIGKKLIESNKFWRNYRIIFNLLLLGTGIIAILQFQSLFGSSEMIDVVAWGTVANGLYSFGYVLESEIIIRTGGKKDFSIPRIIVFWIGTAAYMIATYFFATYYFYYIIGVD